MCPQQGKAGKANLKTQTDLAKHWMICFTVVGKIQVLGVDSATSELHGTHRVFQAWTQVEGAKVA